MKLTVQGIKYSIDSKEILRGIDFQIEEGSFVGIVGPNGCGKSTLVKNIYRVYKPDSGVVFIDGNDVASMTNRESAHEMSVMQQENNIEFDMTVYDMVMLGRYSHQRMFHNDKLRDKKMVLEYIKEVGLEGYEDRSYFSLSGGEKQRTLVARALVQNAPLIILDEPTNHLDIGYQYQIMNILKRQKLTVLACVHDLNIASIYCDRIIMMKKGLIVADGTPKELLIPENIKELFGIDTEVFQNKSTGRPSIVFLPEIG